MTDVELISPATPAAPPHEGEALTVLSANLKNPYCSSLRVERPALLARLEAFALLAEAERADVLLCQEVGRGRDFRVDKWLSDRLGLAGVYARANGRAAGLGREEGLAIFSRFPLRESRATVLAGGLWRRMALGVTARAPWGDVALYTTHHSLRPWRNRLEPGRLFKWVEATAGECAAVIGGDFNASENAAQIAALASTWRDTFRIANPDETGATHDVRLFGRVLARKRLDYLFLRPDSSKLRLVTCQVVDSSPPFSDHRAVLVRLAP